ncbi:MAG: outer membrane beta-barrel protein [Bacteroidota bacterium]|nr:outer membrane beta-barrel protein [Bacteroidota bacterium]
MNKNLQNIEDLFYSALNDIEEVPSQNFWESVDEQLNQNKIISIKKDYTNLKRIALMLLLLLISFSLFEINTNQYSNKLANNNEFHSDKLRKSTIIINKALSRKITTDSSVAMDEFHIKGYKKENILGKNSIGKYNGTNIRSGANPINRYDQDRKKNIPEISISEKGVSENQKNLAHGHKGNPTLQFVYPDRIENSNEIKDEKLIVENNDEKIENKLIENFKLQLKDSVNTKKSIESKIVFKSNVSNKSNNDLTKIYNEVKASAYSITLFFSPDIAWYRLHNDNFSNQSNNAVGFEREEKHEFSSTYGVLIDYNLNKRWGVQTGVTLSNINITINPETLYAQPDNTGNIKYRINTSSGYGYVLPSFSSSPVIGDSLYAFTSTHSLQYIGVPIAVTYNFYLGKFKLNVVEGLSANLLVKSKLETTVENGFQNSSESINKIQGLKNIYFSGLTGINVDLRLTKRTSISITPTMRYALNSINKNTPVKSYPVSFGSVVGLKIGL